MNLGNFSKQPVEAFDYDIDYSEWLTANDNVVSSQVTVAPTGLTIDFVLIADPRVKIFCSGGTDGTTYKITVTTTTDEGRVKQDEFKLKIKDF